MSSESDGAADGGLPLAVEGESAAPSPLATPSAPSASPPKRFFIQRASLRAYARPSGLRRESPPMRALTLAIDWPCRDKKTCRGCMCAFTRNVTMRPGRYPEIRETSIRCLLVPASIILMYERGASFTPLASTDPIVWYAAS